MSFFSSNSSAGKLLARECTYYATILNFVTVEGWGKGKYAEEIGTIEKLVYLALRSTTTPQQQANNNLAVVS